jgi:phage terminase small subunit
MASRDQPLKNQRHEIFAQGVAAGMTQEAAFVHAGYKRDAAHARRLARNGPVKERISFIKGLAAERTTVTLESLLHDACKARDLGFELKQIGPAVAAIKELGILTGLRVEKRENAHKSLHELTNDELRDIAARGRADAAGPPGSARKLH